MLAENIAQYLKDNGITQSHIAERTGMNKMTFSNAMRGKRRLTAEEYVSICDALGKSADYFRKSA